MEMHSAPHDLSAMVGVAAGVDVTDQRAMEEPARTRAAQRALLTAQLPVYVWTTDRDLRLISSQGGFPGGTETEVRAGLTLEAFFGTTDQTFPPIAAHRRALGGESAACEIMVGRRLHEVRVEPLRDMAGAIVGCVGMGIDVTAQRETESRLHEAQRQLVLLRDLTVRQERELAQLQTGLSEREFAVVRLIAQGRTNAQIAACLFITQATVKAHVRHINEKLGTANRHEIAALAWERGWSPTIRK